MRVLQISSARDFGGGERHLVDLTGCLRARGHKVFVAMRSVAAWRGRLDFLAANEFVFLPLKNALDVRSARELARFIEREKIEIVHAHLARDYSIAALAIRLSRTNARLVLTRHVLFAMNRLHKLLLPRDTQFIAVSKVVRDRLVEQKIAAPERIALVYNGIDAQRFAAAGGEFDRADFCRRFGLSPSRRFVGIVGEIVANKGQTDFVRAARKIAADFEDVDFLVVGRDNSPDERHKRELKQLINALNLTDRIHLLGWQPNAAAILPALAVFVSASRVESFGLAIVEAMAAKVPIVAAASAGAREILSDGETGKLAPINDAAALAANVEYFLNDDAARASFAARAQTAARERFDLRRMAQETETVYQQAANRIK